jgi:SAM-dependent methyltransferase
MIRSPVRRTPIVVFGIFVATATAVAAVLRHGRGHDAGHTVPGGILIGNVPRYDALSGLLLGPLFRGVAADVAAVVPEGARVLEVGCGPGHLSIALARRHGLDVTGLDLDPAMIERARANASRVAVADTNQPTFTVGDAASLPFPDGSFDLVVSTFSMHHWANPSGGLAEIGRVLRSGAPALIWDFRPGAGPHLFGPRHEQLPDPVEHAHGSSLRVASVTPWRWPWRFRLAQRIELVRAEEAAASISKTGRPAAASTGSS